MGHCRLAHDWEALASHFHVKAAELTSYGSFMDGSTLYDYEKLDDNGDWVEVPADELLPSSDLIAFQGSEFDSAPSDGCAQTLPLNDALPCGEGTEEESGYPDPPSAFETVQKPYYIPPPVVSTFHDSRREGTPSVLHASHGGPSQETLLRPQLHHDAYPVQVHGIAAQGEASGAICHHGRQALGSNKRSTTQMQPESSKRFKLELTLATIPEVPPPKLRGDTTEWVEDQEEAFNVQVGKMQMSIPEHNLEPAPEESDEEYDEDRSATPVSHADEPYPCRYQPCRSEGKHQPFMTPGARNKHETIHKEFYCKPCRRHYRSQEALEQHNAKKHADGEEGPFSCDKCGKQYSRKDFVVRHAQAKHPKESASVKEAKRNGTPSIASSQTAVDAALQPCTTPSYKPDLLYCHLKAKDVPSGHQRYRAETHQLNMEHLEDA